MTDQCRKEFEEWCIKTGWIPEEDMEGFRNRDSYNNFSIRMNWDGWKAAWNARANVAPDEATVERVAKAMQKVGDKICFDNVGRYTAYVKMAKAAIEAMGVVTPQWRPIEEAPRDGTQILVYTVHGDYELTEYYKLERDEYILEENGLYRKETKVSSEGWNGNRPTHFMQLPQPPKGE